MNEKFVTSDSGKLVVGLTGIFGAGKTTATKFFEELGAFVLDADQLAHEALEKDSKVFSLIQPMFADCVESDGSLSREKLARIVFSNPEKRKDLESVVHPYVLERIREVAQARPAGIILLEVPLLFEAGFDLYCDVTITVQAPLEEIEARLIQKGFTADEVKRRWNAQTSQEDKAKKSTYVVRNLKDLNETKQEVQKVWNKLLLALKGE